MCRKIRNTSEMSAKKSVIKNADLSEEMQQEVIDCATHGLEKCNIEKDIAAYIKKAFLYTWCEFGNIAR